MCVHSRNEQRTLLAKASYVPHTAPAWECKERRQTTISLLHTQPAAFDARYNYHRDKLQIIMRN